MNTDVAIVVGFLLAGLALSSAVSASADRRRPRSAFVLALLSGTLITYAYIARPGGYSLKELPEAVVRVIAMIVN